ncbi:MAG TPA: hypothetical protein V6C84_25115 [Coleofasciculaceae cyanobacterium]
MSLKQLLWKLCSIVMLMIVTIFQVDFDEGTYENATEAIGVSAKFDNLCFRSDYFACFS